MTAYRVFNPNNPECSPLVHLMIPVQGIRNLEEGVEMIVENSRFGITSIGCFQTHIDIERTLSNYRAQHCLVEEFSMEDTDADEIVRAAELQKTILEEILPKLDLHKPVGALQPE
ncbi:MAG: hypothetical protein Q7R93_05065 [bacterium]|nr:hypothetical protein [bacterium]